MPKDLPFAPVPGQLDLDGEEDRQPHPAPRREHVDAGPVIAQATIGGDPTLLRFNCPCGCEQHLQVWADTHTVNVRVGH